MLEIDDDVGFPGNLNFQSLAKIGCGIHKSDLQNSRQR
jgi:hypothetical protein